ncbi:DNA polymerase III subunit gamma/tau [Psychromonas arctica]|uniref:DNA polymerase III subunit gamma/tau n=1 Tax=Psychromonas arctica TaxID=168275 RepID=UPI00042A926A|nr:DNA polymerase III subunit gamma/tau [Psychromonas arctica]
MSYQVLARKWRPQTFKEVIGQPHVLTALENGLAQDRVHHAYLFSGTRGVGKTTIARILAKSLNCEVGVTATPCGKCANCQAIDQGRFVDLLEIDAASRTKVDDTRELLDNVQYKPAQGRYKVYLIDEVHMLSKHSFNALLKTLEEPPEYVKFLLATTDPQKLPITVLSRCLQFHLKAILPEQIEHQLAEILKHEKATFEQAALGVIAKAADGSMRDALSLTDQALAFGAGHIEYAAVLKMLGTIDQSHLHYLLHFIASGNSQKVFEKIQEFVHLGADFSALHQELASLCHQIALIQLQLNANVSKKSAVQLLAERLTPEEVQLFYQIAVQGFKDYAYAPNGKIALEMTVMRLLAFKPANYVDIDESMLEQVNQNQPELPAVSNTIASAKAESEQHLSPQSAPTIATAPIVETAQALTAAPASEPSTIESNIVEPKIGEPNINERDVTDNSATTPTRTPSDAVNSEIVTGQPIEQASSADYQQYSNAEVEQYHTNPEQHHQATNYQPVTQDNNPENNIAHHAVAPVTSTVADTSQSRNMLRSHRLKREALKKTEAATEQQSSNIHDRSVAAVTTPTPQKSVEVTKARAPEMAAKAGDKVTAQSQPPVKASNEQELPPLSSYQEQPPQGDYNEYDAGGYFDQQAPNMPEEYAPQNNYSGDSVSAKDHSADAANDHNIAPLVNANPAQSIQPKPVQEKPVKQTVQAPIQPVQSQQSPPQAIVNNDISALNTGQHNATDVELIGNNNLQTLEIDIASYVEDKMTDEWFLAIKAMQLVGFEKLLAKSTVMQKNEQHIQLTLHESQQHLLNNQSLCEDLKAKLRDYYGQQFNITIEAGNVAGSHTPMELEKIVYQQYLDNAKLSIKNDPIVQTFVRDYAAKVYENSVVPL